MSNEARKAYRQRLKAAGVCYKCRKKVEPERYGKELCGDCTRKMNAYQKQKYARYRAEGRCCNCGRRDANTERGRCYCFQCAIRQSKNHADFRERKKTAGAATPNGQNK